MLQIADVPWAWNFSMFLDGGGLNFLLEYPTHMSNHDGGFAPVKSWFGLPLKLNERIANIAIVENENT